LKGNSPNMKTNLSFENTDSFLIEDRVFAQLGRALRSFSDLTQVCQKS